MVAVAGSVVIFVLLATNHIVELEGEDIPL